MAKSNAVIIKRVKKVAGGHHGGAWKVAYADFVTAMMAFFLLLWLLNATTDAQKRGIADYFSPTVASKSTTSGAGGVMGGRTMNSPGSQASPSSSPGIENPAPSSKDTDDSDDETPGKASVDNNSDADSAGYHNAATARPNPNGMDNALAPNKLANDVAVPPGAGADGTGVNGTGVNGTGVNGTGVNVAAAHSNPAQNGAQQGSTAETNPTNPAAPAHPGNVSEAQYQKAKADHEEKQFKEAEQQLRQAIQQFPDLKPLAQNLVVQRTEDGLSIQMVDQEKTSMFPLGSQDMTDQGRKLMSLIAQAVSKLPNKIAITGHTDATPYMGGGNYSNWELSSDRANASRRALVAAGMPADRIATVVGKADTQPLDTADPNSPRNRRISIVLLRESKEAEAANGISPGATGGSTSNTRAPGGNGPASTAPAAPQAAPLAAPTPGGAAAPAANRQSTAASISPQSASAAPAPVSAGAAIPALRPSAPSAGIGLTASGSAADGNGSLDIMR